MSQTSHKEIAKLIRRNSPITVCGLTLSPITMEDYEEYSQCSGVLTLRLSALPARYAAMPYLKALYCCEMDAIARNGGCIGLLERLLRLVCMATGMPSEQMQHAITFITAKDDPLDLKAIGVMQNGAMVPVDVAGFNKVREIIALQNGEELPNEADNMELVEAEKLMRSLNEADVEPDADEMMASVAAAHHMRVSDLLDWPIREFAALFRATDRTMRYQLNAIAEGNGCTWKTGNPVPCWYYNRRTSSTRGVMTSEKDILQKFGQTAEIKS